jgi:hypothetical protein
MARELTTGDLLGLGLSPRTAYVYGRVGGRSGPNPPTSPYGSSGGERPLRQPARRPGPRPSFPAGDDGGVHQDDGGPTQSRGRHD